jgi:hypothetical protein
MTTGLLHHVELWVPDLDRAITSGPGLNHLAFHAADRARVDALAAAADGYEVELVAG